MLEVDPDNAVAREQVGQVVAAVRQFDQSAPSRRWLGKLQQQTRRQRLANGGNGWDNLIWIIIVVVALVLGLVLGHQLGRSASPPAEGTRGGPAASNGCARWEIRLSSLRAEVKLTQIGRVTRQPTQRGGQ